jgi:cell division septum initiation protein DivIVA
VKELKELLDKLKKEYERLLKKKKDTPQVLDSKKKIVNNC